MRDEILIKNGRITDPSQKMDINGDILIRDGKIAEIRTPTAKNSRTTTSVINVEGCIVCPGFVDLHCHLREPGYEDKSTAEIVREICDLTDGATMSAKKDALVNIGGFLAVNDEEIFDKARNMVVIYEGLHTYGGMAGRDMEALALGIAESVQEDHIRARVGQVLYLGQKLI